MWAVLLAMTNGEVDRAMSLETTLTQEWYVRYQVWNQEMQRKK